MAKYIKGLNKDAAPVDQPEGSYRYAKNILSNETAGAISNEPGNIAGGRVPVGHTVIGSIETTDDIIILFTTDNGGTHTVTKYDSNSDVATVVLQTFPGNSPNNIDFDLKFSTANPIEGTYKIDPDDNLLIYWTDNVNPPRSLNVTRQLTGTFNFIYNVNPFVSPNKNYIDRINLFPHTGPVPSINFKDIALGGALKTGTYYLFLAYVDQNFTQTNFVSYSLGVPIVEDIESVLPIERYDGAPAGSQTGKSIVWTASNLNTDYEFLRPVVVTRIDGVEKAFKLNDLDISGPTINITFSGLEGYEERAVDEVVVDTISYDTVKTLAQLDGVLYLGNLSGTKDIGYQKYANNIKASTVIDTFNNFDPIDLSMDSMQFGYFETDPPFVSKSDGYRDINNISSANQRKGYFRDDVYAFYIAFILNDGSMSYAYHIPGRKAGEFEWEDLSHSQQVGSEASLSYDPGGDGTVNETDSISGPDSTLFNMTDQQGQLFHFYDFSSTTAAAINTVTGNVFSNIAFWQNKNELYPQTDDYLVHDETGLIDDIRGSNVRHHHMPSNANSNRRFLTPGGSTGVNNNTTTVVRHYVFFREDTGAAAATAGTGNDDDSHIGFSGTSSAAGSYWDDAHADPIEQHFLEDPAIDIVVYDANFENWPPNFNVSTGALGATVTDTTEYISGSNAEDWQGGIQFDHNGDSDVDVVGTGTINNAPFLFKARGIAWWDEVVTTNESSEESNTQVHPLGIKLHDIKIPRSIANKVQGFRIYYAERTHTNRRILGQDILKNTKIGPSRDLSICGEPDADGTAGEPFIENISVPISNTTTAFSFHDFYLLNPIGTGDDGGGVRKGIAPATHTTALYQFKFSSGNGNGDWNVEWHGDNDDCTDSDVYSNFHFATQFTTLADPFVHYPIREKCRTYVNGDSIFDGRSLGFGRRIYNLGGESHIMLGFNNNRIPNSSCSYVGGFAYEGVENNFNTGNPDWAQVLSDGLGMAFSADSQNDPACFDLHNLQAFKTDMYLSYDTQELIWTGYEVVDADELENFIYEDDGNGIGALTPGNTHETGDIYGGDTFICRHGYRKTSRTEYKTTKARDSKSLYYVLCESTDNINFRHVESKETSYFPGSPTRQILSLPANDDLTDVDNIKYNRDYSLGIADIKPAIPYPLRESDPSEFKTRVQRSATADNTSLIDNYRVYLALQFKDLPRNRGSLHKLIALNNLLHLHTQDSLFRTKGKETLQLSDGTESFVGSGDIFSQDPDELIQTKFGYGGTQSQWVSIVTKSGYFTMDYRNRKVFLLKDQLYDISKQGLESWFQDNIPFALEQYGLPVDFDNPIVGIGFHAMYDERYDRILLTKKDLKPTEALLELLSNTTDLIPNDTQTIAVFNSDFNQFVTQFVDRFGNLVVTPIDFSDTDYFTPSDWTISYDVELNVWASFHDYVPYKYTRSKDVLSSFNKGSSYLWLHNSESNRGSFYSVDYASEFEFIYNGSKDLNKVVYSFEYTVDVFDTSNSLIHDPAFSSFYVYNTHQISDEQPVEYMINTRRIGNEWKINKFRDLALLVNSTSSEYTGPFTGSNFGVPGASVAGTNISSVETTSAANMFTIDGMSETINAAFINATKSWNKQRKFVDKWVGIRLKYDNITKKLINLYSTDVAAKKFYR